MIRKGSTHGGCGGGWLSCLAGLALAAAALWAGQAGAADAPAQGEQAAKGEQADTWRLKGRVVDDRGQPVTKAEVLLLGQEGIIVDAPGLKWFVFPQVKAGGPKPASRRTDQQGQFEIERASGGNRVAILAKDLPLWVVDRQKLPAGDPVEIKLPRSGSLAVELDLPGKPAEQEVLIGLCTFDRLTWYRDKLRWHFGTKAKNPGKTVFEHLPPATYAVERNALTKTGPQTTLMTQCDRQLATVEPGAEATVRIDHQVGRPLKGHVAGLQDVPLAFAHLTIQHFGPEEGTGPSGKASRQMTALDVIPITSEGVFATDPIPPGEYWIDLFAVRADNPEGNQSDFKLKPDSKSSGGQYRFTVPAEGEMPPIELAAVPGPHAGATRPAASLLRVVGPDGKPVARPEVSLLSSETNVRGWIPGADGQVPLADGLRLHEGPVVNLVVRAEGFAASIARFAGDELEKLREGKVTISLDPGQEVELELRLPAGTTWPKEVEPVVFFESFRKNVWLDWQNGEHLASLGQKADLNLLGAAWPRPGVARLRLSAGSPPFRVSIHARGFLRFFESGPLTLADVKDGRLAVDVPQPGRLDLQFEPVATAGQQLPFEKAAFSLMWKLPVGSSGSHLMAGGGQMQAPWGPREVTDLAPGKYRVTVSTRPKEGIEDLALTIHRPVNPGRFFAHEQVSLRAGQTESVKFAYTPLDPDGFRGDRTATLRILRPDDSAAAGAKLLVTWSDLHYGSLKVFSGEVPESGIVTIEKITARATDEAPEPYTVWIEKGELEGRTLATRLGTFGLAAGAGNPQFSFRLPPDVGDLAPDVALVNMSSGSVAHLHDFRGKVVLVDFWATWCGPCQEPLREINKTKGEMAKVWKDRAVILPISIDEELDTLKQHVASHGWTNLDHFWAGNDGDKAGFEAAAARAFVVAGVPTSLLIGRDGRILWRGHPAEGDLVEKIAAALRN